MAEKNAKLAEKEKSVSPPKKSSRVFFKIGIVVLVLVILSGLGFAAGVYLKLVDLQGMGNNWKLYNYPIIGQYFTKPQTNFEPVDLDGLPDENQVPGLQPVEPALPLAPVAPIPVDPEKEKQEKLAMQKLQQEENKRISKMARLYGAMKPEEAVSILNKMDDNTVIAILSKMEDEQVAKIMALMDSSRAARLTQSMMRGR
ncbi:MAG: hypothetical protein ABFC57_05200 [Veillonellales bacterium]